MSQVNELHRLTRLADEYDRREFLKLMGAAVALASFSGCRNRMPPEEILPYAKVPPGLPIGEAKYYASAFPMPGFVQGILVESHDGRPTKIEGSPHHPDSQGATGIFAQASILDLYAPDRLQTPKFKKTPSTQEAFHKSLADQLEQEKQTRGQGLAILLSSVISPTLRSQLNLCRAQYPEAKIYLYEGVCRDNVYEGVRRSSGTAGEVRFEYGKAKCVVAFDHDFLAVEPNSVINARDFMQGRAEQQQRRELVVLEPSLSLTGAKADLRFALSTAQLKNALIRLENMVKNHPTAEAAQVESGISEPELKRIATKLLAAKGRSIVAVGFTLDPELHAIAHRINGELGNLGETVFFENLLDVVQERQTAGIQELIGRSDQLKTLIILGGDPVFNLPGDLDLASVIQNCPFSCHLTSTENETSSLCKWVLPESHYLEQWSDVESVSGALSIVQPLIEPLYASYSAHEVLNLVYRPGPAFQSGYEIVREYWLKQIDSRDFEQLWRRALLNGVIDFEKVGAKPKRKLNKLSLHSEAVGAANGPGGPPSLTTELVIRPDATVWDGCFANNPWLQELPKPPIQLTWDNALLVSPKFASGKNLDLKNGDLVEIEAVISSGHESAAKPAKVSLEAAVFVVDGLPSDTLTLSLGYGQKIGSHLSGFRAQLLRTAKNPWVTGIKSVTKTAKSYELASTQLHHNFGARDLIRSVSFAEIKKANTPNAAGLGLGLRSPAQEGAARLYDEKYQWGMSIDLESCIGCSACVVACQAENNIPTVGKRQVLAGREMHWIRIDRYSRESSDTPSAYVSSPQPVTCMHCETAPCEYVCPVAATTHSADGLNQMVYNRCVGTRYCSNNCPYKVRRFNFFKFSEDDGSKLRMQKNPDVTVRSRGVMEKCTYCVQRIQEKRIQAQKENRVIRDGEIVTACEQVCPTRAIVFGNILDPNSRVSQTRKGPRTYGLLTELGTRPRTTYLATIKNESQPGGTL